MDTTKAKTINERLTLNLLASTSLSNLFEDLAHKAGYVRGTFDLAWADTDELGTAERSGFDDGFQDSLGRRTEP
ncbi:hypothetical protein AAFF_G00383110 [Aldrovandia affinis]|uniref:Uncharacterized protein n=1 Tax=Aldrovandia affinis TaxID=143900 RepID=A0AAD7T8B9_9TELE|nr:hypothetical protein AAFF_G00383110 [Aldrovandia affinis]